MPLKDIRICPRCNKIRWQGCSKACPVLSARWLENIQEDAGTFKGILK